MSVNDDELRALLREMDAGSDERRKLAQEFYGALERHKQTTKRADVTYRCRRGCLLATVYQTAQGVVVHLPRHKYSPAYNEAVSNKDGRAKNTEDGGRRWKAQTYFLDQAVNASVSCDHLLPHVLANERIENDLRMKTRRVAL